MMTYALDATITISPVRPALSSLGGIAPSGRRLSFTNRYLEIDGRPVVGVIGEIHFARRPAARWEEDLRKMKAGGINLVSTYIFWIHHEEIESRFDWSGDRDLRAFAEACRRVGLDLIVRIGPFCHGEVRNGGFPDWLYGRPFPLREDDPRYLEKVRAFYGQIGAQLAGLFFRDGGPIVGVQVENELGHAGAPWETTVVPAQELVPRGKGGAVHLTTLKQLAREAGIDAPIWTSTGWGGAPVAVGEVLPLYGGYAFCPWNITAATPVHAPTPEYLFRDFHSAAAPRDKLFDPPYDPDAYPFACCEMGGGMQVWYQYRFVVPPECAEAMAYVKVAGGCSIVGYYMYSGGTNPLGIRGGFLNEHVAPRRSYDFQAPLSETGLPRESYHRLRLFHYFLADFAEVLGSLGTAVPVDASGDPADSTTLRYAARTDGRRGFLFLNAYQDHIPLTDSGEFAVELITTTGLIRFPRSGAAKIGAGQCAALPFGLDLSGVELVSATAQPIFRLAAEPSAGTTVGNVAGNVVGNAAEGEETWFFLAIDRLSAEFVFNQAGLVAFQAPGGQIIREREKVAFRPELGWDGGFHFTTARGVRVRVVVLPKWEALGLWKARLAGRDRAILTDADALWETDDGLELRREALPRCALKIYPPLESPATGASLVLEAVESAATGSRHAFITTISGLGGPDVEIGFDPDLLTGLDEAVLEIRYAGDVGNAFIDGELVHDDFWNGLPWRIPLSPLADRLGQGLYLHLSPKREGAFTIAESGMAAQRTFTGRETARIDSVAVIPVYAFTLKT